MNRSVISGILLIKILRKTMKQFSASLLLLLFVLFSVSTQSLGQERKAPDFTLKGLDGKEVKLSDFKNKVVILDFWATWCPPCRKGIPDLIELQKEFKKDLVVIGISLDTDSKEDVPGFVKNYGINYHVVYGDGKVVNAYGGVSAIPTSFIIDKKGNVQNKHVGLIAKEILQKEIKSLID